MSGAAHVADLCPHGVNVARSPFPRRSSPACESVQDAYSGFFQTTTHLQEPNCHHIYFSSSCFPWPGGLGRAGIRAPRTPDVPWDDAEASVFPLGTDVLLCHRQLVAVKVV